MFFSHLWGTYFAIVKVLDILFVLLFSLSICFIFLISYVIYCPRFFFYKIYKLFVEVRTCDIE
jgi:hypothetical protein